MQDLLNFGQMLACHARLAPNRIGARDLDRSMTFAQWNARSCRLANALLGLGLAKGDRVAILAYNCVEWVEIYAAMAKAGLVAVPVNFRLVAAEARYILENAGASALIVEDELAGIVEELRNDMPVARDRLIHFGKSPCPAGYRSYEDLLAAASDRKPGQHVATADPWMLMYTSGTTGRPKGAIRSHRGGRAAVAGDAGRAWHSPQRRRIADIPGEIRDNRRGAVEILASPAQTLQALLEAAGNRMSAVDRPWAAKLRASHVERARKLQVAMAATPPGSDGRLHPNSVIAALQDGMGSEAIVITDGGDFLSFARVGLSAPAMLDPGPFGCIGIGVPYGIAASLAFPDRPVIVATGDGAFGFNAIEIDTAVRHKAPVLIVVANNGAWQIEVHDQAATHGKVVGTRLQFSDYAAMARSFGMHAERVETQDQLQPAIARALANRPALLDVVVTPEAVSSDAKSGLAWVPDLQPLAAWDAAERQWRSKT